MVLNADWRPAISPIEAELTDINQLNKGHALRGCGYLLDGSACLMAAIIVGFINAISVEPALWKSAA